MKFERLPEALPRPGDSTAMLQAIERLRADGHDVRRPAKSNYQLKVASDLSFYPDKGTIFRDGDPAPFPDRGLLAMRVALGHVDVREINLC
jgi:hypothetical protein